MPRTRSLPQPADAAMGAVEDDPLYVVALSRGLAILACCGSAGADLTVSEIAKRLGMSQSTVWRACHTMLRDGYLVRTDEDRLRPGLPLLKLGHAALVRQPLAELARPGMKALAADFPGAASLGVRQGFEMLYVQRVDGGPVIYPGLRVGSRVTLIASAMGWAWLAGLPAGEREPFLEEAERHSPELFARLRRQMLEAIRVFGEEGMILNSGVIHPELNAIGVPIGPPGRAPIAAISFGGLKSRFPPRRLRDEVAPRLRAIADALSLVDGS